jgi:hypothetical protein
MRSVLKMRLYLFNVRWYGDEEDTHIIIEANTQKEAEKVFKLKCKEKEWSTEFSKYKCKRIILENGMFILE